jgi:5'-methylthioadenosine phosphorylase
MGILGIIGGTSFLKSDVFHHLTTETIQTPYGEAFVACGEGLVFLQRHGPHKNVPPHRINHRANLSALRQLGVDRIMAFHSTGGLRSDLAPGTIVIPHDFFCPWSIPTFFDQECRFVIPKIDEALRQELILAAQAFGFPVRDRGVYVQTTGPRFETPAEIRFFAQVGDVVGMTAGQEIPLSNELDIPYATACMVDNFANGISPEPLTVEQFEETVRENQARMEALARRIVSGVSG